MSPIAAPDLLPAVAAFGLNGPNALADAPLHGEAWRSLFLAAQRERLNGLLAAAVTTGSLATTREQAAEAAEAHAADMCEVLVLERLLLDTVDVLAERDIECRVLKGPATAHLDYPDPTLRSFIDIDLMVTSAQFDAAVDALSAAGYRRRFAELRPGFDRRFNKGASFRAPTDRDLDLHRTFVLGPFGLTVDLDDVWAASVPFALAGRTLRALDRPSRFGNACLHAVLGDHPPRLVPLRDVAQMVLGGAVHAGDVADLADRWRAAVVLKEAVLTASETLGLDVDLPVVDWARSYRPRPAERRALRVYLTPGASYASKARAAVHMIPAWRDKASYMRALLLPQASYLARTRRSHLTRWRQAAAHVVHTASSRRSA